MFILVNTEMMQIVEKHPALDVITNLAWFGLRHTSYDIFDLHDASGFSSYTNMELEMLYKNITQSSEALKGRNALKQVCFDLADALPVSVVKSTEVEMQASRIEEDDEQLYTYVRGSTYPKPIDACNGGLFVNSNPEQEKQALSGKTPALKRVCRPLPPPSNDDPGSSATPTKSPAKNAPKRGTAKAIIWQTADKMWEAAGKPMEKGAVLKLRKLVMDELEKEAIKRSSASSELGVWQKTRIIE